jgi:hypothetical protein
MGVIVAAGADELEFVGFAILLLSVLAGEEEALDFGGGVERVTVLFELFVGVGLEHAAHVARVGAAVLVDDVAEDHYLAGAEDVGRNPIEGAPVNAQAQIALLLRRKAADRRAVEGQVLIGLEQELLVVVEQVKAAFEVAEQHGDSLDPLLIGQVLQPLLTNLVGRNAIGAVCLGLQVEFFQLLVGEC